MSSLTCRTYNVESIAIDGQKNESSSREEEKKREEVLDFYYKMQTDILY